MRHQGAGNKKVFRDVDFIYDKKDIPAKIVTVEYDPYRTGFIGLVNYKDGEKRYVLLPKGMKVGDTFHCFRKSRNENRKQSAFEKNSSRCICLQR